MNEQKDWIVHVLAAYFDPLVDSADAHGFQAFDTILCRPETALSQARRRVRALPD